MKIVNRNDPLWKSLDWRRATLRGIMISAGLSVGDVASYLLVTNRTVWNWKNDKAKTIPEHHLDLLAVKTPGVKIDQ